jgi:hypothetical protein
LPNKKIESLSQAEEEAPLMTEQVTELLYRALETENGGIQIYETALKCVVNPDLKKGSGRSTLSSPARLSRRAHGFLPRILTGSSIRGRSARSNAWQRAASISARSREV